MVDEAEHERNCSLLIEIGEAEVGRNRSFEVVVGEVGACHSLTRFAANHAGTKCNPYHGLVGTDFAGTWRPWLVDSVASDEFGKKNRYSRAFRRGNFRKA